MVEVLKFPKACPHCQKSMDTKDESYYTYLECRNDVCVYHTSNGNSFKFGWTARTIVTSGAWSF